ncbi:MAG TPA: hypothetical protein VHD14_13870 [Pseudolabrys sp.]|nr:hypothetical protein [Pseudolabrys sp.]
MAMPTPILRVVRMIAAALPLALAACAASEDSLSKMMVAPGKFVLYTCDDLLQRARTNAEREQQLHMLMAKAQTGAGGDLVNSVAYRPELATLEGEDRELQQTAADKKCTTPLPTAASLPLPDAAPSAPPAPPPRSRATR